ncbi:unnamed protein product [Heligmosomoides polygyrus]|uniref:PPIase cyclophilin-type domain-containing protein n=1 Tax=Heligmosomoides polygyrus TaxID=6339 RepID=A0A183GEC8_HELPZ|nr:unnamed protein product [Heligmosomoides polygyrus]
MLALTFVYSQEAGKLIDAIELNTSNTVIDTSWILRGHLGTILKCRNSRKLNSSRFKKGAYGFGKFVDTTILHFTAGQCVPNTHSVFEVVIGNDTLALFPRMALDYPRRIIIFGKIFMRFGVPDKGLSERSNRISFQTIQDHAIACEQ